VTSETETSSRTKRMDTPSRDLRPEVRARDHSESGVATAPAAMHMRDVDVYYDDFKAVKEISLDFARHEITALIGPSGCGKSTVLRCLNRMNDLIPSARVEGEVYFGDKNIYEDDVDPVEVRRRIGMVFQAPNPFSKSIYDNVAWGAKINGFKGNRSDMDDLVERALTQAALWDEVKDKLSESGYSLSGGQQQRLCIARAVAPSPEVLLMDEPASALDPIATLRIEELMLELKQNYTIIIVTHNMQQAGRVSDRTAFFSVDVDDRGQRTGKLVEFDDTDKLFTSPREKETEDYITGRFG
jgi:phosphate transport system ATP-binding protein